MRPNALAFLLSSIACLFIIVWGGGYWWISHSREQAKQEQIAREQSEAKERQAAEDRRIEKERSAKEKADREKAATEAAARDRQQADEKRILAAAAKAKTKAEQHRKRVELLTHEERRVFDAAAQLDTKRIRDTEIHRCPGGTTFLFLERDELFEGLPIIERLKEYADDIGVAEFIEKQELNGAEADRARIAHALMDSRDRAIAKIVLNSIMEDGIQRLGDKWKLFVRAHGDLFPKHAPK